MLSNGKVDGVYMRTKQMLNQKTNIRYNSDHCGKENCDHWPVQMEFNRRLSVEVIINSRNSSLRIQPSFLVLQTTTIVSDPHQYIPSISASSQT